MVVIVHPHLHRCGWITGSNPTVFSFLRCARAGLACPGMVIRQHGMRAWCEVRCVTRKNIVLHQDVAGVLPLWSSKLTNFAMLHGGMWCQVAAAAAEVQSLRGRSVARTAFVGSNATASIGKVWMIALWGTATRKKPWLWPKDAWWIEYLSPQLVSRFFVTMQQRCLRFWLRPQ